ncbi:hypothetical protein [Nocardia salmonicida]|uniref:hypothetical protein n=1 Tax=Nocardia salmonicida TaxID=53431 RepID=UPI00343F5F15
MLAWAQQPGPTQTRVLGKTTSGLSGDRHGELVLPDRDASTVLAVYEILVVVAKRRIQFEVSPDEAGMGDDFEAIEPPPLSGFGLPDPDTLVGIVMRFQIARKFHAVSDAHEPPFSVNERPRDIGDLLLIRDSAAATERPTFSEIHTAGTAVFGPRPRSSPSRAPSSLVAANHYDVSALAWRLRESCHVRAGSSSPR